MDPTANPFAPGAGNRPPELAGREKIIAEATIALRRVKAGRHAKSQLLLGLRGVGKTVLLNSIAEIAEQEDILTIVLEAPENRPLADLLVPALRQTVFKLSGTERAKDYANRAFAALRSFASAFQVKYGELEVGIKSQRGIADSGDLQSDLTEVLQLVAQAAQAADKPVAIFIDEIQYLSSDELSALIVATHRIGQRGLPIIVFGAGLPQLAALAGDAKSYAERLFDYPAVGALDAEASAKAIREPIRAEGADIGTDALEMIIQQTQGYPYFLQEWGSHTWNEAKASPINKEDVQRASENALEELDHGFFRVRLDRLTPREKDYVRAMAELGPGTHRSSQIAEVLGIDVTAAAPIRGGLIRKGMIFSPSYGDTAFTVPMFDDFMRRSIPDWERRTAPSRHRMRKRRTK